MSTKRTDANQRDIVAVLRQAGATVQDLSKVGGGCPDLAISFVDRRANSPTFGLAINLLMEVKTEAGTLNDLQRAWHAAWRGPIVVVRSADEALKAIGAIG